jgi:nucleotide-binding universal stress UspA family protein
VHAAVLIGYDGSEESEQAIRGAAELLAPRRAVVAHVWDSLSELLLHRDLDDLSGSLREAADELDAGDAQAAERLARRGAELAEAAGLQATPVSARGRPRAWPTLLELADEHDAAAVVVGSRGLGGVKSALLGSVSSGVLGHSQRPVLVVPGQEEPGVSGPALIAYDGSEHARAGIEAAGRLLRTREALVQTVWSSYESIASAGVAGAPATVVTKAIERLDGEAERAAQETADQGAELAAAAGLDVRAEALRGDRNTWRALIHSVEAHGAAVVVAGSRGRSAFGSALTGSVSRALVHNAPAPVLVVRPAG